MSVRPRYTSPKMESFQSRVKSCPPEIPGGFYWYGVKRPGPARPPKWVDNMLDRVREGGDLHINFQWLEPCRWSWRTSWWNTRPIRTLGWIIRRILPNCSRRHSRKGVWHVINLPLNRKHHQAIITPSIKEIKIFAETQGSDVTLAVTLVVLAEVMCTSYEHGHQENKTTRTCSSPLYKWIP